MKWIFTTIATLAIPTLLSAQSVNEARQLMRYDRLHAAEAEFHTLLKQAPDNAEAWYLLTRTYLLQHNPAKAADSLGKAPASVQQEPYYLIAKGALLLDDSITSRIKESNEYFQKAIDDTKGKNPAILQAVAESHIDGRNGDIAFATDLLQKAMKRDKKDANLFITQGKAHRKTHHGTEAYQAFKEAIAKDKKAAEAYYELGRIFMTQKNTEMFTDYFLQAINADAQYAPAYYALYDHYLYSDPAKAMIYFNQYVAHSDKTLQQDYSYTDLLYLNHKYDSAIGQAKQLVQNESTGVQPRLYKLIAYCYQSKGDSVEALNYMDNYFKKEVDSNFVVKDFETMARLYSLFPGKEDSAMAFYEKAVATATDSTAIISYYQDLARLSKTLKAYDSEAKWLGKFYASNIGATNVTLFNWGIAAYRAQDYYQADSVFGLYSVKYPEQGFGYYWRARSNAAIDTAMEKGLAIPYYQKLTEMINKDSLTASQKKWMAEAYVYLASFKANTEKNYAGAIEYFEKLLEIDPQNEKAQKYIEILQKNLDAKNVAPADTSTP